MYGGKGDPYEKGGFWGLAPTNGDLPATGLTVLVHLQFKRVFGNEYIEKLLIILHKIIWNHFEKINVFLGKCNFRDPTMEDLSCVMEASGFTDYFPPVFSSYMLAKQTPAATKERAALAASTLRNFRRNYQGIHSREKGKLMHRLCPSKGHLETLVPVSLPYFGRIAAVFACFFFPVSMTFLGLELVVVSARGRTLRLV